ncbi:hypothetical protein Tco_1210099 [Tanacetum coccineum]
MSESSEVPPPAKHSKAGKVIKKRSLKSSQQLVDESVDEGVPTREPRAEDTEEEILQKVLEESLMDAYPSQQGLRPPVVFREPDTGKFQPFTLRFKRRTPASTEPSGHEDSSSLHAELGLSGSDTESDEEMPPVIRSEAQDEGQAGPDPGNKDEGQAGPNPDDVAESQPLPTPSVHARPNLKHSKVEVTDASSQPEPEQMDEGFTATDFSFGDQFFNDKPSKADNEKTTTDTKAESMVSVTIHQDTSVVPLMISPGIDLMSRPDSPNVHRPPPSTATTTTTTTTTTTIMTTLPLPPQP